MIAVQSLWLADTGKAQEASKWLESQRSIAAHYPRTVFFGNKVAIDWVHEAGCRYDEVRSLPDYDEALSRAWSIGKLYAAAEMTEPFIHLDGDVVLHRPLDVGAAAFFCQGREPWLYAPDWWKKLGVAPMPLPSPIPWSYNFGVFGGNDWQAVGRACRTAHDFAVSNKFAVAIACPSIMPCVVIEQIWVPALLARDGIRPLELLRPNRWAEDFKTAGFDHWIPN